MERMAAGKRDDSQACGGNDGKQAASSHDGLPADAKAGGPSFFDSTQRFLPLLTSKAAFFQRQPLRAIAFEGAAAADQDSRRHRNVIKPTLMLHERFLDCPSL